MDLHQMLRPSLRHGLKSPRCFAYARFFAAYQSLSARRTLSSSCPHREASQKTKNTHPIDVSRSGNEVQQRIAKLRTRGDLSKSYPRIGQDESRRGSARKVTVAEAKDLVTELDGALVEAKAKGLKPWELVHDRAGVLSVNGRVKFMRRSGRGLIFLGTENNGQTIQLVLNSVERSTHTEGGPDYDGDALAELASIVRTGDWISATGVPYRTDRGEASLFGTQLPQLLAPSLHLIPKTIEDAELKARQPHVGMIVDSAELQTLRMRSRIESLLASWLEKQGFLRVSTPIISPNAGGATAKPFATAATEFRNISLNLRIAPELWLKRLVIGGMTKIYEIGPAFRNEGVDATHNPEFTMCEFYSAFTTLEELISMTQDLLQTLFSDLSKLDPTETSLLSNSILKTPTDDNKRSPFSSPFKRLKFIPALEAAMGQPLPSLSDPRAPHILLDLFSTLSLTAPKDTTLPSLLDELAAHFLEPQCQTPTLITEHPEALSPLAKSFTCPTTGQIVSARAELFIAGREYANMYEEENSPFEQRRKFEAQVRERRRAATLLPGGTETSAETGSGSEQLSRAAARHDGGREVKDKYEIDEGYIEALEWGLPPTGGWGMGVDRLAMLFTGRQRIGDVLAFGTLRNVVGMQTRLPERRSERRRKEKERTL